MLAEPGRIRTIGPPIVPSPVRAMRDNDIVADSLGKNLLSLRAAVLVLGGALAGLSGAILVGFIDLWAPSA